ncbi:MAG: SDR family oxidoreductase [Chloroflexi bacterium]|nr:SDR family oxidoreductase [Chloroflexota bacterium]
MTQPLLPLTTSLQGQVALVTGGAVRVGRVICRALAGRGASIAFTYLPGEPTDEAVAEIAAQASPQTFEVSRTSKVLALPLDVRVPGAAARVVEQVVTHFGRLDILINNASVWLKAPFLEITPEAWQTALDVNLTGPFLMSQAAAPHMLRQQSGLIVNITDLSAYQTWPGYAHHAASKAGLVALTRVMAAELAPHVRVNAIAPGTVLLPEGAGEAKVKWAVENSLLGRVGHPEDVARTVLFLVDSDFATGAVYFIDGGRALV